MSIFGSNPKQLVVKASRDGKPVDANWLERHCQDGNQFAECLRTALNEGVEVRNIHTISRAWLREQGLDQYFPTP